MAARLAPELRLQGRLGDGEVAFPRLGVLRREPLRAGGAGQRRRFEVDHQPVILVEAS